MHRRFFCYRKGAPLHWQTIRGFSYIDKFLIRWDSSRRRNSYMRGFPYINKILIEGTRTCGNTLTLTKIAHAGVSLDWQNSNRGGWLFTLTKFAQAEISLHWQNSHRKGGAFTLTESAHAGISLHWQTSHRRGFLTLTKPAHAGISLDWQNSHRESPRMRESPYIDKIRTCGEFLTLAKFS